MYNCKCGYFAHFEIGCGVERGVYNVHIVRGSIESHRFVSFPNNNYTICAKLENRPFVRIRKSFHVILFGEKKFISYNERAKYSLGLQYRTSYSSVFPIPNWIPYFPTNSYVSVHPTFTGHRHTAFKVCNK